MIEGALRHRTSAEIDRHYLDSHGQSAVGFAFCHLLGFKLLPAQADRQSTPLPSRRQLACTGQRLAGSDPPVPLGGHRPAVRQMVKYASALRLGTAEAEQVLRRFARPGPQHPHLRRARRAGPGRAHDLRRRLPRQPALRREIHEGLQVIENWNSANDVVFFGKDSKFASPDRESEEISMLALHLLQSALVYVNTLLRTIAGWSGSPTPIVVASPPCSGHTSTLTVTSASRWIAASTSNLQPPDGQD